MMIFRWSALDRSIVIMVMADWRVSQRACLTVLAMAMIFGRDYGHARAVTQVADGPSRQLQGHHRHQGGGGSQAFDREGGHRVDDGAGEFLKLQPFCPHQVLTFKAHLPSRFVAPSSRRDLPPPDKTEHCDHLHEPDLKALHRPSQR